LIARSIAFVSSAFEKSPGGATAPIPFSPNAEISIARKIAELDAFIRTEMERHDITGLSVALISDGKVSWTRGYGVTNSISRRPVRDDTIFEGASLGKCLTTYAALKLVQEGRLDLHKPLSSYLTDQFVANSPWRDQINAWHVMTHTSGLSNDLTESTHAVSFEPGSRFSYSGVGYMYLQQAIEGITRRPFNDFMTQTIFAKLVMGSTSYFRAFGKSHMARGHGYVLGFAMPMPYFPMKQPNAANLLCTTATDLAKFVAELMSPSIVNQNLVDQMLSPQVHMGGDLWWGLGIAVYPAGNSRCFWHWGDNMDFESYLLGCPRERIAVVVMSNSSRGRLITREVAKKALGE
jgi:CubicO group peptidase (beta-lactamase class C family)